jgi:phage FluMu protein Com
VKWTITCPYCKLVTPWEHVRVAVVVKCVKCDHVFRVRSPTDGEATGLVPVRVR